MPRLGLGSIDLSAVGGSGDTVTTIDDFFFESDTSGEVTPIYTASRKQFARNNNDVVLTSNVTKDTSIAVPPGQTGTAIRVIETTATSQHFATVAIDEVTAGDTYTMSLYVKSTYSSIIIYTNTTQINSYVTVNFTNGTIATSALRAGIEDAGGGWYRVNWTQVAQASGGSLIYLVVKDLSAYTGSTSNFTDYFGMQVEQDSRASSFMLNTTSDVLTVSTTLNDTSEVWDFDSTDIMLEADPEDEGFWEEGSNLVLNGDYADLGSEEVTNGDFSQISSELVTNGDFATDSDWSKDAGWTISNGAASCNGSGINSLQQSGITTTGKVYKLTFDITSLTNESGFLVISTDFSDTYVGPGTDNSVVVGSNTFYIQPTSGTGIRFRIADGTTCTIDNVSIKEVGQDWGFGTGWNMGDGKAVSIGSNEDAYLYQNNTFVAGKTYKVTFDVNDYTSGTLSVRAVNEASALAVTSTGSYVVYIKPISSISIGFRSAGTGGYVGSVDNISIQQVDPNDRWSLGTNVSISDGKLNWANSPNNNGGTQSSSLTQGTAYEVTFTVSDYSSGSVRIRFPFVGTRRTANGTYTQIGVANQDTSDIFIQGEESGGNTATLSVDNVTVREYAVQPKDI